MPPRRACLLARSPIADDPRVRRMGDSLAAAGWDVCAIGLSGARTPPPAWRIIEAPPPAEPKRSQGPIVAAERAAARGLSACLGPVERALGGSSTNRGLFLMRMRRTLIEFDRPFAHTAGAAARRLASTMFETRKPLEEKRLEQFWRLGPDLHKMLEHALSLEGPTLWIANDWWTLPIAAAGLDKCGGSLVYDSHELATEEYNEQPLWVRFQKPIVDVVERRFIGRAALVTSVSPGITEHLRTLYTLSAPTMTLRNTPNFRQIAFRPTGETIGVLYHGVISPGRGLEAAIDSTTLWRPEFSLHLRGPAASPKYLDSLRARAAGKRVTFHPPVAMTELVPAAAPFDVGLMALPAHSLQNTHALPNKLFEYLMAGLALAVTDLPEMARLVADSRSGVLISDATPEAIAAAINSLSRSKLDELRSAALEAAKRFNWEVEAPPVLARFADLTSAQTSDAAA